MPLEPEKGRLKELISKRSSAKGQITKFKNYLSSIAEKTDLTNIQLTELNLKLAKFEALSVRVDSLQSEIEVLNADNMDEEIDERDLIDQEIITNIATAKTLLEQFGEMRRGSFMDHSCHHDALDVGLKLPRIQIAKFDGSLFKWLEFRDTFENLIHNNTRISPVNKFHYLISYLEGDAARILTNMEVSNANYTEAWDLLCARYNNKRILISHHLNSLFSIKPLLRESEKSLRFLVDHITKNLRALSSLGQPTDSWDVLIIFMLSSKLDSNTLIKWEEYRNSLDSDTPSLDIFFKFLTDRADVLDSLTRNSKSENMNSKSQQPYNRSNNMHNNFKQGQAFTKSFMSYKTKGKDSKKPFRSSFTYSCVICNENHKIYDCPTFQSKGIEERLKDVNKYKLCMNCLRQGHPVSECRMGRCRECNQAHNSLLHRTDITNNNSYGTVDDQNESFVNFSNRNSSQVLLSTAIVEVSNPLTSQKEKVRVLLDCGSQTSFITNSLKNKMSLRANPIDSLKVIGIGNSVTSYVSETCNIHIKSLTSNYNASFSCLVLNELTGYIPKYPVNIDQLKLPKNILLADPTFHQPAPVHMLIGADLFWDLLGDKQISLGPNNPKLRYSQLGWIISGPMSSLITNKTINCNHVSFSASFSSKENTDIQNSLSKFWDLEEVPKKNIISENDEFCEKHFVANTRRDSSGRFCVKLPLKDSPDCLGDTLKLATKRFHYLEKRLRKNTLLKHEYLNFISEYATLGHLSLVSKEVINTSYYLCHHAVLKQDSESTKLRVVFDGSARSSSGYSLNDILMVGPNLQDSLFAILIRARQYKYLLTGDIEKMYRQVLVEDSDRDLQRILWRENNSQPLKMYRLNTLTYGTASASFLSTRCLQQLGLEHNDEFIRDIILKDFYVDDLITGANSEEELRYIQRSISETLKSGCFKLRKYKCNAPSIFKNISMDDQDNLILSESTSTLGLGWTPSSDTLHFPVKNFTYDKDVAITKIFIMSNSFKIFDPLGLLSPVVIQPKIILQKLWQQKIDWDQQVTNEIRDEWIKFVDGLRSLSDVHIPRIVLCEAARTIELHTFSDASQSAYGACVYIKSTNSENESFVNLLCAKSKVCPLKPTTIPRLELCAALLAAKLCKSVLNTLRYRPQKIIHWCDSSVVLCWINSDVTKLKSFVCNRIGEIIDITEPSSWRYVPTALNPADLISRGMNAKHIMTANMWWSGPSFLLKNEIEWPVLNDSNKLNFTNLPEIKVHSATLYESIINFEKYSSFTKLQRCIAYVLRFIFNLKNPNSKKVGILTVDELNSSFTLLCASAQRDSFAAEHDSLVKRKQLNSRSKILSLSPFLDQNNLIRVGGRIDASIYSYDKRHPILLHADHRLTRLYFEMEHLRNMHAGPQLLLASVRETVWPVNGRHLARRIVNNCVRCRRLRAKMLSPKMGNLPAERVNPGFPFISVGIDYAGPFQIINRKGRGSRLIKCYLCLFVCLKYKCIHLEPVSDLTRDAFIMTLRRFIARRGKPKEIFSDNGRNFVAAAKDIGNFIRQNEEPLSDFASQQGITFKFIPTYAPHFGGIWEAGVKSAKHHLRRVIGNSHLTFEEISTLFAQVEAILNSRPLCPMSSNPNDLLSLSPGHFIIGRPLTALPPQTIEDCSEHLRKRYERLEGIRQHFWQRWQREYIAELQQRTKWKDNIARLKEGDMVLISEDSVPPLSWRLGRVLQLFPGPDGVSRVADVVTSRGCVRRPLVRLCPLPTADELQS